MKTKLETARDLAKAHFRVEPNLKHVVLILSDKEEDPKEPIKLLEVVEGTTERGIEPVAFTANPGRGIAFPSIVVEISPNEYQAIRQKNGKLDFEDSDWKLGQELRG